MSHLPADIHRRLDPPWRDAFDRNVAAFRLAEPSLLAEHRGEWALVQGGAVRSLHPGFEPALEAGYEAYGCGEFIAVEIGAEPVRCR